MKNKILRVIAGILKKDDKILITRRKRGEALAGKWELPGVKVEKNESPEECLHRELFEEFNIEVDIGPFFFKNIHDYDDFSINLLAYIVLSFKGEMKLHSHDKIAWIHPLEFKNYEIAEADKPILRHLIKCSRESV